MSKIDRILELISEKSENLQDEMGQFVSSDEDKELEIEIHASNIELLDNLYNEILTIKNSNDD